MLNSPRPNTKPAAPSIPATMPTARRMPVGDSVEGPSEDVGDVPIEI